VFFKYINIDNISFFKLILQAKNFDKEITMKKVKLKNNAGFAASDALIAIIIITIFTGIIATLAYNIYLSNASLKRMSKASNYIVDIFEYVDKLYYEDVNDENLLSYVNEKYESTEVEAVNNQDTLVQAPFKIIIKVQKYNEITGNEEKLDLVKEVTATVKYKLGNKDQSIEMKKNKNRENIITPNRPELSLIQLNDQEKVYPVKQNNEGYTVCNENDMTWYNYSNDIYAIAIVTTEDLKEGERIEKIDAKYRWIPRYAINVNDSGDIKYLFSNTNNYLEEQGEYGKLVDIGEQYILENIFEENSTGIWEEF
jgi:hypothetical protein